MKQLIALTILVASLSTVFSPTSSWAQDDGGNRAVNPGDDPNEAKSGKASEADVAATGVCPECIARIKHTRLGDDTTYRPRGSSSTGEAGGASSSKDGTR